MAPPPDLSVLVVSSGQQLDLQVTLRSLALQTDVSCATTVVDDSLGEVAAAQRAIDNSSTKFITFLRAGDVLLPGALRAMRDALVNAPRAGLADALWLPLDAKGRVTRQAARSHVSRLRRRFQPDLEDCGSLAEKSQLPLVLPTFRRETLRLCGRLSGASLDDALRQAASRVGRCADVRLVPQILCATPRLGAHSQRRMWRTSLDFLASLWRVKVRPALRRVVLAAPFSDRMLRIPGPYEMLIALLQPWSFRGLRLPRRRAPAGRDERIAYVLWRYPTLSETFIRREVEALREAGLSLEVFALEPDDPPLATDVSAPTGALTYFGPERSARGRRFIRTALRRHPWMVVRLWLFVVRHRHRRDKTWWRDRNVLYLAGQLAAELERHGITHVHSPWANHYAFVSCVASRLLGISYSAQARAFEIQRSVETPLAADRLRFAEFVITNSRYNESYLRSLLAAATSPPIHTVYEGLDLQCFCPGVDTKRHDGRLRLLSVARLVEPKGLRFLLHACHALRDRGLHFACDIIGGPEAMDAATWVQLRALHSELALESCVDFHGAKPFSAVLEALRCADVFVLPCVRSRDGSHDVTPNSLIEAMAMALPVVSTPIGAIPEIVDDEINGLLVAPEDPDALATAIERLLHDGVLRRTLGDAARRKVEERFDVHVNVQNHLALFRSLRLK